MTGNDTETTGKVEGRPTIPVLKKPFDSETLGRVVSRHLKVEG
jgi:hypothetical protein